MTGDPVAVEGPDGEVVGYECPECATLKTSEGKAEAHCENSTDTAHSTRTAYPALLDEREYYVPTARDEVGRKRPRAPHLHGHSYPAKWSDDLSDDDRPEADLETVLKIANLTAYELESAGWDLPKGGDSTMSVGAILPRDRPPVGERVTLIDWDDVRNPETGEIHPVCAEYLRRYRGYADISVSGTGVHQLVLGGLGDVGGKFIAYIDDEPAFEALDTGDEKDDWPQVEIYDGGRHVHMSGRLIDGAENEIDDGQAIIDELVERFEETATAHPTPTKVTVTETTDVGETVDRTHEVMTEAEYTGPDPDEWEIPEDSCLEYHAAVEAHYHGHSTGNFWRVTGAAAAWGNKLGKTPEEIRRDLLGADREGTSAGYGGKTEERVQYDWRRAEAEKFKPPSRRALAKMGLLPADYAVEDNASGGVYYESETCTPPGLDREPYDTEQRWDELQGERYQEWLDQNRPTMIWGDDAGSGKTTNAALAAAVRDRSHTVLFDKHEKAREFIEDDATPDGYFHLKGGEQPEHDCCMNAAARADEGETPECPVHGHPAEWPRMNPIYERDPEDDLRQRYEALVSGVGPRKALTILDEDGELLDDNPWLDQFDGLEHRDRVVGVHEYQTLKTAVGDRDLILDETPRLLSEGQRITVDGLTRAQLRFEDLADLHHSTDEDEHLGENFRELADFTVALRDAIAGEENIDLADIDRPQFKWESYFELKDPISGQGVRQTLRDETLAQLKITYNEGLVTRIRDGEWNGEPFCIDVLLAAAAVAGTRSEAARRAIVIPSVLDECPWCGSEVGTDNGARHCTDGACGWHEAENRIVNSNTPPARAIARMDDDVDTLDSVNPALVAQTLPPAADLPSPLVLDATATPSKVAAMYGEDDVAVTGDDPLELDQLDTTQVVDGQYHAQTIKDTPSVQDRIQSVIDTAGEVNEQPLFGIRSDLIHLFEFPENGEVLKYHAARGLNRAECDAVVCIGAPHPDVEDLTRDAELLAMDRDDLRVGGNEHSTRRNAPNPPVYRKLLYEDEEGHGVAVPTKHYTGVTGDLFRESREKELEQFAHRIRPLLADSAKDAYLLTNVPTAIPIDKVVQFDELTGDLSAVFPVSEGSMRLLRYGHEALDGNAPDGFRTTALVEEQDGTLSNKVKGWHRLAQMNGEDVTQRTIRNWVNELETVGLLVPEKYEQRAGVAYTADIATSKRALQVLSYNAGFEVAALRRLGEKIRQSAGSIDWLDWAESVFDLSGDRCLWGPEKYGDVSPPGGPS